MPGTSPSLLTPRELGSISRLIGASRGEADSQIGRAILTRNGFCAQDFPEFLAKGATDDGSSISCGSSCLQQPLLEIKSPLVCTPMLLTHDKAKGARSARGGPRGAPEQRGCVALPERQSEAKARRQLEHLLKENIDS